MDKEGLRLAVVKLDEELRTERLWSERAERCNQQFERMVERTRGIFRATAQDQSSRSPLERSQHTTLIKIAEGINGDELGQVDLFVGVSVQLYGVTDDYRKSRAFEFHSWFRPTGSDQNYSRIGEAELLSSDRHAYPDEAPQLTLEENEKWDEEKISLSEQRLDTMLATIGSTLDMLIEAAQDKKLNPEIADQVTAYYQKREKASASPELSPAA